jgi:hypothetical protein
MPMRGSYYTRNWRLLNSLVETRPEKGKLFLEIFLMTHSSGFPTPLHPFQRPNLARKVIELRGNTHA